MCDGVEDESMLLLCCNLMSALRDVGMEEDEEKKEKIDQEWG